MLKKYSKFKSLKLMLLMLVVGMLPANVFSAPPLNLPNVPLAVSILAEPNVVMTLDNSGSMNWTITPDSLRGALPSRSTFPDANTTSWSNVLEFVTDSDVVRGRSSGVNITYYNPEVYYEPWSNSDATLMADATPSCASYYPLRPGSGCVNLTVQNTRGLDNGTRTFWPATYFNYNGGNVTTTGNYTRVEVKPAVTKYDVPNGAVRQDCTLESTVGAGVGTACTYNEEIQNFANWFTYYRARMLLAKAGVGKAFSQQRSDMRVGYATLNSAPSSVDGVSNGSMVLGVRHFADPDRTAFFDKFYAQTGNSSTPLRRTLKNVGRYYQRTDNRGPWGNKPGINDTSPHAACRQAYHILTTDGFWNGSSPGIYERDNNNSTTTHLSPTDATVFKYRAIAPYKDPQSDTLADTALYYWDTDLRPDLGDYVPINASDPAFWQHMVNYTVGLGVQGQLTYPDDWAGLQAGTTSWPAARSGRLTTVDDLWHAAVNSRGQFFSAQNPEDFASALSDALNDINSKIGSVADVSVDALEVGTDLNVFSANYVSGKWFGELTSKPINLVTGVQGTPNWYAQALVSAMDFDTDRKIATFDPVANQSVPFRWASLTAAQQAELNLNPDTATADGKGSDRLDYVRGKTNIPQFRRRPNGVLGDIVNSSPVYVGAPTESYPESWDGPETSFNAFKTSVKNRTPMVYVGANDGMMHAFEAATGVEKFAYVPNGVISNLNELSSDNYKNNHRFFVDGIIKTGSAFFNATAPTGWRTVIAGTLRKGGKAVYAMDVTDPTVTTEADVGNKYLWEFTDGVAGAAGDDMGYVYGDVAIVRMANGDWAAVFGNGYNSVNGKAVLYIVNIESGVLMAKIDMGAPVATSTNGLSSPLAVDVNGDSVADYIYAGDLQGNVWKVDVRDTSPAAWGLMYGTTPLFVTTDASGNRLPITTRMEVGKHPTSGGYLVYVGTGKYIEGSDGSRVAQNTQTVFGIWDKDEATLTPFNRSHLLQQDIYYETALATSVGGARLFTDNLIDWYTGTGLPPSGKHLGWRLDLINTGAVSPDNQGERIINNMILRPGRIIFTSFIPPIDPCIAEQGEGWFFQFNAYTGGRLDFSVFDINDDNVVLNPNDKSSPDLDKIVDPVNGGDAEVVSAVRVNKSGNPKLVSDGSGNCMALLGTSTGGVQSVTVTCDSAAQGRQSWIRLQ